MIRKRAKHIGFIVIFLALLFSLSLLLQDSAPDIQSFLGQYTEEHPYITIFLFVLFAALSVLLGPFTSAPLASFAVALWGTTLTLILLVTGWLIGNGIAYFIGYSIGYPIVRRLARKEKIEKWKHFLSERVGIQLLFLFRLATPSEVGYVFGILRYRFLHYITISLLAEIPFALLIVFAGEAIIGNQWELFVGLIVAGFTIVLSSLYFLKSLETKHRKKT